MAGDVETDHLLAVTDAAGVCPGAVGIFIFVQMDLAAGGRDRNGFSRFHGAACHIWHADEEDRRPSSCRGIRPV